METLIPWSEMCMVTLVLIAAAGYKYVEYKKYVRQYPYKVQRMLRSTDRTVVTWNRPEVHERRTKTIPVVKGAYVDGKYHETWYMKERDL